jgi:hypothetical protein
MVEPPLVIDTLDLFVLSLLGTNSPPVDVAGTVVSSISLLGLSVKSV